MLLLVLTLKAPFKISHLLSAPLQRAAGDPGENSEAPEGGRWKESGWVRRANVQQLRVGL